MSLNSRDIDNLKRIVKTHYAKKIANSARTGGDAVRSLTEKNRITAWLEDCARAANAFDNLGTAD